MMGDTWVWQKITSSGYVMKIDTTFLRSKVARRIFILFVFCALLPIAALAIISFSYVTNQLNEQSQKRLHQGSKTVAMSIFERLLFLEAEIKRVAFNVNASSAIPTETPSNEFREDLKRQFRGLVLVSDAGEHLPLFGRVQNPPKLTPAQRQHLSSGRSVLSSQSSPDLPSRIFMSRALDPQRSGRGILLGEINEAYLWKTADENPLPAMTKLCVLDPSNNVLFCSDPTPASISEKTKLKMTRSTSGQFEWGGDGKEYLARYRDFPLKVQFHVPYWTAVVSEMKADVLAPMASFTKMFSLVILLSLWLVLFLSIIQIRRSMVPLEKLQEGTRRIAVKDFTNRVTVKSGDEFEELADSFNNMAGRLGWQFHTLATMAEIDRAILSILDTEKIVDTVLTRMCTDFPCDRVSMTLLNSNGKDTARTYLRDSNTKGEMLVETVELTSDELKTVRENPERLLTVGDIPPDPLLPMVQDGQANTILENKLPITADNFQNDLQTQGTDHIRSNEMASHLRVPLVAKDDVLGILSFSSKAQHPLNDEETEFLSALAGQAAIAIYNSKLYEQTKIQSVALEKANKVKTDFLSIMSHELRTPLTAVIGYTSILQEKVLGEINQEQEKTLGSILRRSNDLLDLIQAMVQASRLYAGDVKPICHEANLKDFLDQFRKSYSFLVDKEVTLTWDYPSDLPVMKTDFEKIKHILENLLSNAIKFTKKGGATVSVSHCAQTRKVAFKVADTGVGIPKESLPHIFELFSQVDGSGTRSYEGAGLGLFLVKKLTEVIGGKIEVESTPGKGSTFTVTVPVES